MATRISVIQNVNHYVGWHNRQYFGRYHRRFHTRWYWLTGAFLLEMGFWLGVAGLVLSIGLLFFLLSTMTRIVQEGLNR